MGHLRMPRCGGGLLAAPLLLLHCKIFVWWLGGVNAVALLSVLSQPACFYCFCAIVSVAILIHLRWIKVV